jgi:hypothetical protein
MHAEAVQFGGWLEHIGPRYSSTLKLFIRANLGEESNRVAAPVESVKRDVPAQNGKP